jgi:hypothetical protein
MRGRCRETPRQRNRAALSREGLLVVLVAQQPVNAYERNEAEDNRPEPKQQGRVVCRDQIVSLCEVGHDAAVGDDHQKGEKAALCLPPLRRMYVLHQAAKGRFNLWR